MSTPYLAIEMMDLHPDERAELLKIRYSQLKSRPRKWKQGEVIGQLIQEFDMTRTHIYNVLEGKTGY